MKVSEKRELYKKQIDEEIDNADNLLNIREVRNQIAHDYVTENINGFYLEVLNYIPHLKRIVDNVKTYYFLKLK